MLNRSIVFGSSSALIIKQAVDSMSVASTATVAAVCSTVHVTALGLGFLLMGLFGAHHFGRFHGGGGTLSGSYLG